MKDAKPLPSGIQFSFVNLSHPDTVEFQIDLHVFMGDEVEWDEPVLYRILLKFGWTMNSDRYEFEGLELFDQHDITPYDHLKLEK